MLIGNVISYRQSMQDDYSKSKSKAKKKKKKRYSLCQDSWINFSFLISILCAIDFV